jgi:hypothetical protein
MPRTAYAQPLCSRTTLVWLVRWQPPASLPVSLHAYRDRLSEHLRVVVHPILGGVHHEYELDEQTA